MPFPKKPFPKAKINRILKKELRRDLSFRSGKIIGSMCSDPPAFCARIFRRYIEKNLGDPGLCPGTAEIERRAVEMLGSLLGNPSAAGVFTTGGTEANILALLTAKKLSASNRREVILSDCAHFSFRKAAEMMDLKLIFIPHKEDFSIDVEAAAAAISACCRSLSACMASSLRKSSETRTSSCSRTSMNLFIALPGRLRKMPESKKPARATG